MKINKSELFKAAWEMVNDNFSFSQALTLAWKEAKYNLCCFVNVYAAFEEGVQVETIRAFSLEEAEKTLSSGLYVKQMISGNAKRYYSKDMQKQLNINITSRILNDRYVIKS